MIPKDRIHLQWQLLSDAHPRFCVSLRGRDLTSSLLVEPENIKDATELGFDQAKIFHHNLLLLTDEELVTQFQELQAQKQADFEARQPFNQADALATDEVFEFWSRAEFWTLGESAVLINGKNPLTVNENRIEGDRSQSKIAIKLKQTLELLERAREAGSLNRTNSPQKLINWLELKHIEMPQRLKNMALQRSGTSFTLGTENRQLKEKIATLETELASIESQDNVAKSEKPIGPRERESLLKLILGMAIKGYSYDPKATKSTQISEIAGDLQLAGLALDEDTVRKYLNEAKALFADALTEQNN